MIRWLILLMLLTTPAWAGECYGRVTEIGADWIHIKCDNGQKVKVKRETVWFDAYIGQEVKAGGIHSEIN